MQENEFLQQVFDFKVKEAPNGPEIYVPENEEVSLELLHADCSFRVSNKRKRRVEGSLSS